MQALTTNDLSILLVEPSDVQRRLISQHLQTEGITQIEEASCIESALTLMRQYQPDLVVCAYYFADGTGLDLIRRMRQDVELESIPFMLVSSEQRRAQLEAFKQAGVVAILPKPFTHQHLFHALNATMDLLEGEELELSLYDVRDLRVLLVDDSRMARKYVHRILSNLGIEQITEADNGRVAIDSLSEQMFDVIITDYNMPEVNGRELAEHVRFSEQHGHVPILMVSSDANELKLNNIEHSGVNALCDKPFEPRMFKHLLYNMLETGA